MVPMTATAGPMAATVPYLPQHCYSVGKGRGGQASTVGNSMKFLMFSPGQQGKLGSIKCYPWINPCPLSLNLTSITKKLQVTTLLVKNEGVEEIERCEGDGASQLFCKQMNLKVSLL